MLFVFLRLQIPAVVIALASLALSILLGVSSRSFGAVVHAKPVQIRSPMTPAISSVLSRTAGIRATKGKKEPGRALFELAAPFESVNDECERVCLSPQGREGNGIDNGSLINPCPKCVGKYTPCNFCCYQGASSLKLRFFGCPGQMSIVFREALEVLDQDGKCDFIGNNFSVSSDNDSTSSNGTIDYGVQFVDCDCFDDVTDVSSSSFGNIASCALFDRKIMEFDPTGSTTSHFDICLVSTTDFGDGPVANFSYPLPDVIGLEHVPYLTTPLGDDDSMESLLSTSSAVVTYFETSCDEKGAGSNGSFAYPLFPGYGKFVGSCPDDGFIDFENETPRLPDNIVFVGQPPSTSFYYEFIDGTSVGFWPSDNGNNDSLFFEPTFATCKCRDCEDIPTNTPSSLPVTSPSPVPTLLPSGTGPNPFPVTNSPTSVGGSPTLVPTQLPNSAEPNVSPTTINPTSVGGPPQSPDPTLTPTLFPSSIDASPFPTITNNPSPLQLSGPTLVPTTILPTLLGGTPLRPDFNNPSTVSSEVPAQSPSSNPSIQVSTMPSLSNPSSPSSSEPTFRPTTSPSMSSSEYTSESPSANPSSHPSSEPTFRPTTSPSMPPSENTSESPSGSFYPSVSPSENPTASPKPSHIPSFHPSNRPSGSPTASNSDAPSLSPSENPTDRPSDSPTASKSDAPSSSPSENPAASLSVSPTSFPVTYRCPPSDGPTNVNNTPVTPSPIGVPDITAIPTDHSTTELSTLSPTEWTQSPTDSVTVPTSFPTSFSSTIIPTESLPAGNCVGESECHIFALVNCVDKDTGVSCFPPNARRSRRVLEKEIEFHQAALENLIH